MPPYQERSTTENIPPPPRSPPLWKPRYSLESQVRRSRVGSPNSSLLRPFGSSGAGSSGAAESHDGEIGRGGGFVQESPGGVAERCVRSPRPGQGLRVPAKVCCYLFWWTFLPALLLPLLMLYDAASLVLSQLQTRFRSDFRSQMNFQNLNLLLYNCRLASQAASLCFNWIRLA